MLEGMLDAGHLILRPDTLLAMLIILPIALISGVLPGGGLPIAVAVLGFAAHMDPWIGITLVVFAMSASDVTQPVPAIFLGVPGSRSSQATILDGYPMAQQGLGGIALGASYVTTLIGGVFGALVLLLSIPMGRIILAQFGSGEFFLLMLMGVMVVGIVSAGALQKGLLTATFGLAIALIGFSPIGGDVRATLGIEYLWDGISIAPLIIGLFAIPEAISLVVSDRPIARARLDSIVKEATNDVLRGMKEAMSHKWLIIRSSLVGTFIGMMPGLGGGVANWLAYAQARETEKGGRKTFGTGDIRGVIASDAANNSSDGGSVIPTVMFGIPGSSSMVIVMAILILGAIVPGPDMLTEHLHLTIGIVYLIALANIVVVPIVLLFAPTISRIATVNPNVIAPVVIGIVTLSAFMATQHMGDMILVLVFGLMGVFMKAYGWPRAPILIAVVLSRQLERYMWISINTLGMGMLTRAPFLAILAAMAFIAILGLRAQKGAQETPEMPGQVEESDDGR